MLVKDKNCKLFQVSYKDTENVIKNADIAASDENEAWEEFVTVYDGLYNEIEEISKGQLIHS